MTISARGRRQKGDKAERELCRVLGDLGFATERCYGAGRPDDKGDVAIDGFDGVVQVKSYSDITRAVREGLDDAEKQRLEAGLPFAVAAVRRPGGRWVMCMEPEMFAGLLREMGVRRHSNGMVPLRTARKTADVDGGGLV